MRRTPQGRPAHPRLRSRAHPGADRRSRRPDAAGRNSDRADLSRFAAGYPRHRGFPPTRVGTRPRYRYCGHPPVAASAVHRDCRTRARRSRSFQAFTSSSPRAACAMPAASAIISSIGFGTGRRRFCWSASRPSGTLGRFLDDGAKAVRIQGEEIKVAARIRRIDEYSGHADGPELARWIAARRPIRRGLFLVHGEEPAIAGLAGPRSPNGSFPKRKIFQPVLDDVYDLSTPAPTPARCRPPPQACARGRCFARLAQ